MLQRTHPEVLEEVVNSNLPSEEINNKLYQTRLAWIDDMSLIIKLKESNP